MKRSIAAGAAFALFALLFWITLTVRWIAGDGALMASEMLDTAPPEVTGLAPEEYPAMGSLTAAFLTGTGRFQIARTGENGEEILYFHDYEEAHMEDVRGLIRLDTTVMWIALAAAALLLGAGILLRDSRAFARGILWGLGLLGAVLAGFLIWALVDFEGLFVTFHQVAFTNDGWLLDPQTDLLIRLMPERFFMRLGIRGLARALAMPIALAAAAGLLMRKRKNTVPEGQER